MADERIDLIKKVYSKTEYPKIIDTKFNQLGVTSLPQQIADTFTVEEFFEEYNNLFYEIPPFGETNSHEYLIKSSTQYIDYDQDSKLISDLQDEIVQLRKDLLQAQIEKAEAISGQTINFDAQAITDTDDNTIQQITEDLNLNNPEEFNEGTTNSGVVANSPSNSNSSTSAGGSGTTSGTY